MEIDTHDQTDAIPNSKTTNILQKAKNEIYKGTLHTETITRDLIHIKRPAKVAISYFKTNMMQTSNNSFLWYFLMLDGNLTWQTTGDMRYGHSVCHSDYFYVQHLYYPKHPCFTTRVLDSSMSNSA